VRARHHGFTPEELDFILNYDIKYRLGRDTETEKELLRRAIGAWLQVPNKARLGHAAEF
jgi:hypothetical protein